MPRIIVYAHPYRWFSSIRSKTAMSLEQLIESYGYIVLVIGTFLEGETILVLGGIAAKLGYLQLYGVVLAAFIGSLAGDQLYFFL